MSPADLFIPDVPGSQTSSLWLPHNAKLLIPNHRLRLTAWQTGSLVRSYVQVTVSSVSLVIEHANTQSSCMCSFYMLNKLASVDETCFHFEKESVLARVRGEILSVTCWRWRQSEAKLTYPLCPHCSRKTEEKGRKCNCRCDFFFFRGV